MKSKPAIPVKKKTKRRKVLREKVEPRKRRKDRREAKVVVKKIEDFNKFERFLPEKGDDSAQSSFEDWKGTLQHPLYRSVPF
jgi:hypothetical protein